MKTGKATIRSGVESDFGRHVSGRVRVSRGGIRPDVVKNVCWGIAGGFVCFLYLCAIAVPYALSVIGLKKSYACVKCALFTLAPFGKTVASDYLSHKFGNTFWAVTTGWQLALFCVLLSGLAYATYFGRLLGAKWFLLAQFVIAPFGAKIRRVDLMTAGDTAIAGQRDREREHEL